jgi:hypothetical protein
MAYRPLRKMKDKIENISTVLVEAQFDIQQRRQLKIEIWIS